jgi:hypothetical protein
MTHVAVQQRLSPDPEAARAIEDAPTPGALVHKPVRGARIGQGIEGRQRRLHWTRLNHVVPALESRGHDAGF